MPTRLALGLVRLLQNANVKSKEFPWEEVVDHSLVVENGLAFQANSALKLAVFAFGHLPVLLIEWKFGKVSDQINMEEFKANWCNHWLFVVLKQHFGVCICVYVVLASSLFWLCWKIFQSMDGDRYFYLQIQGSVAWCKSGREHRWGFPRSPSYGKSWSASPAQPAPWLWEAECLF